MSIKWPQFPKVFGLGQDIPWNDWSEPLADLASVRYLTWLSSDLSRRRAPAGSAARRPTAWIRSQLLLLARLLDRLLLLADDTPELELVVDVGDVEPPPGIVFTNADLWGTDCKPKPTTYNETLGLANKKQ